MQQRRIQPIRRIRRISLSFIFVFSIPCFLSAQVTSYAIHEKEDNLPVGVPYFLPQTSIHVDFYINKKIFTPGIYADYAEKYLGLQWTIQSDSSHYDIADIRITPVLEVDPSEQYIAVSDKQYDQRLNRIFASCKYGISYKKHITQFLKEQERNTGFHSTGNLLYHSVERISLTGNLKTTTDTLYKTVFDDSVFVQVPIYRQQTQQKTREERAEETAELLINLKKAQLTLLADWEAIEAPKSKDILAYAIEELRAIEKDYLEQFTGTVSHHTIHKRLSITPITGNDTSLLFHFSEQWGIHPQGFPVYVTIEKIANEHSTRHYKTNMDMRRMSDFLFIRYAQEGHVKIYYTNNLIAETQLGIYQYGTTIPMPVGFFMTSDE